MSADFTKGTFGSLADYLLGDKVLGLEAASFTNTSVPWEVMFKYETAIRKKAFELVREEGMTLKTALKAAMKCDETRALHFTAYITLGSNKRRKTGKGQGGGGGQGDPQGQWQKNPRQLHTDEVKTGKGGKAKAKGG